MIGRRAHWDRVYEGAASEQLGWHQSQIATAGLVTSHSTPSASVIDVGGGDSRLVDALLDLGYGDLTVLDLSRLALDRAQARLGASSERVAWLHADLTDWTPDREWDLWHDRAVFHFLTDAADRAAYVGAACAALSATGVIIVATFGLDGPETCAGLPVCRYDEASLVAEFDVGCEVLWAGPLPPVSTSEGDQRPFVAAVLRRSGG